VFSRGHCRSVPLDCGGLSHRKCRRLTWGNARIQGELRKLGFEVSAESVRCYCRSAPRRPPSQSWRTFIRNHAPHIWDADFFTVPTVTFHTLYVLFFITHDRRRMVHLNVTAHPTAEWVWRQLIAAAAARSSRGHQDRHPNPAHAGPGAEGERDRRALVGTLRCECLDHLIVITEQHLRALLAEYAAHYNAARPHRALALDSPDGRPVVRLASGRIVARPVLDGIDHEYEWVAA